MAIKTILNDTISNIQKDISYFLNDYHQINDDDRMELSRKIFNQLRDFFQEQKVMIEAVSKSNPGVTKEFYAYRDAEVEIWEIYEHAIMMHVDEPDNEYKDQIERLQKAFRVFSSTDYDQLLEKIQAQLDPDTESRIQRDIQKQPEVSFST